MEYYYYTKWTLEATDEVEGGIYHSTFISSENPHDFCHSTGKALVFIRQFESLEELEDFAQTVGLRNKPRKENFVYC